MKDELKKIIDISRDIGQCLDLVQGAGGNFSIKIDKRKMLIKASGLRMSEISENNGLVAVDYGKISKYYDDFKPFSASELNSIDFINSCVLEKIGSEKYKPSIETGFHALLGKYVIHTHSVYANIIACALNGESLLEKIFQDFGIDIIWLSYSNPGLQLALCVKEAVDKYKSKYNKIPEAILMQNHGLIVSGNNLNGVFKLHNEIQETIKARLNLGDNFPKIKISETRGGFESQTRYLKDFIKNNYFSIENFSKNILFPDQAVFCNSIGEKILINEATGDIFYKASQKEALAIEENLTAWAHIVNCAKNRGLNLNFISQDNINYISNMESEKYRQQLLRK